MSLKQWRTKKQWSEARVWTNSLFLIQLISNHHVLVCKLFPCCPFSFFHFSFFIFWVYSCWKTTTNTFFLCLLFNNFYLDQWFCVSLSFVACCWFTFSKKISGCLLTIQYLISLFHRKWWDWHTSCWISQERMPSIVWKTHFTHI